ncbi:MAG: hypothetical protein Q8O67_13665 [Deltaproteobacteria bacterium]|nr:hypothetical protein [Deltaproteobacteria bacterium]
MTSHAPAAAADGHQPADHGEHAEHIHPPVYYVRIWGVLLVLLAISIAGPMLEIKLVTLMTAFGIAIIKAWLVCSKFMHLNIEKKFVVYFLAIALGLLAVFYFGVASDVMKHEGLHWKNVAAQHETARALAADKAHAGEHGEHGAKPDEHKKEH